MAPIIPLSGVVAGLFRTLVSKQVTPQNYAKIKDLVNTLSRYIKDGKLRLTKTQNKAFNQQKNELTRFESRFRARTVPTKLKENVLPFRYKKSMKQEFAEMKPTTVEDFIKKGDWDPSGMASGGIAGQLHLNQGGEAMPDPDYGPHTQTIDDDWYLNKYEKFLDGYLKSQEGSSTPLSQQDVNIMSSFFNNYVEYGGDPTKFEERIQNLLKPPEKHSSGLSHILGV